MSLGRGILAIWHDVQAERLPETLDWYDREHHLERLAVPGFRNVRRYHAVEADRFLFIRYETDTPAILTSPAYLERLNNPTAWTQRSQPGFLGNVRSVCTRDAWAGWAEGGFAVTARILARDGAPAVAEWPALSAALLATRGILGVELWRADRESSTVRTDEKRLRGQEDGYVDQVIVVHASTRDAAVLSRALLAGWPGSQAHAVQLGTYQLAAASSHIMS